MFTEQYVFESLRRSREEDIARFARDARLLRSLKSRGRSTRRGIAGSIRVPRFVRLRPAR